MSSNPERKKQYPKAVQPEHREFLLRIGIRLKALREQKNLSVSQLAKKLGITRNGLSEWEKGTVYCNMLSLLQLLDYYEVSATDFFRDL